MKHLRAISVKVKTLEIPLRLRHKKCERMGDEDIVQKRRQTPAVM